MPRHKSPAIDAQAETVLTWLFAGLIVVALMLGLLGTLLR
jgi:hypothetical protein